jgi:drug/metabolite transporter (DMT)-like permease
MERQSPYLVSSPQPNPLKGYIGSAMSNSRALIGIWAAFAAIYVLWGSTYLATAVALHSLPPFLLMGTRSLVGGVVLLVCGKLAGGPDSSGNPWPGAIACGLFFFVGCHGVLAYAQQRVPSGTAAIILSSIPFWIVLVRTLLPGDDRPNIMTLALLLPGIAGVVLIAWQQLAQNPNGTRLLDIVLLIGAAASWAIGTVLSEKQPQSTPPMALSGMELIAGGIALMIISVGTGEPNSFAFGHISAESAWSWVYLTLAGTVFGFAAYVWLLNKVSPTLVSTYTFVNPIIAVLLGWAVLGERPTGWVIGGAALVIASIVGLLLARRKSSEKGV